MYLAFVLYIPVDDHFFAEIYESSSYAKHKFSTAFMCALFGAVAVCVCVCVLSFSNLSDDRSNASSKTVPPHSAI